MGTGSPFPEGGVGGRTGVGPPRYPGKCPSKVTSRIAHPEPDAPGVGRLSNGQDRRDQPLEDARSEGETSPSAPVGGYGRTEVVPVRSELRERAREVRDSLRLAWNDPRPRIALGTLTGEEIPPPKSIPSGVAPSGFEPLSPAPKASMLGHYTTGLGQFRPGYRDKRMVGRWRTPGSRLL